MSIGAKFRSKTTGKSKFDAGLDSDWMHSKRHFPMKRQFMSRGLLKIGGEGVLKFPGSNGSEIFTGPFNRILLL